MDRAEPEQFERIACPLCGSPDATPRERGRDLLFGARGEFQYVRCRRCGHVYLNPRPKPECLVQFYPSDYGPHQPHEKISPPESPDGSRSVRQPWYLANCARRIPGLRRLYYWAAETRSEYIPDVEADRPRGLELGCASGQFLARMRERGWQMQGVEFAPGPARRAAERGFEVHAGTLESAPLPPAEFDAVFAWMVLEHLPDPVRTLREIRRVLKPGGWLAFSVPNYASWERRLFGRYWYALMPPVHLQQFTPRSIRAMLNGTGFDLIRIEHQRTLSNVIGSIGLLLRETSPFRRWGQRLVEYPDHPGLWARLAAAPLANLLAWMHQGGRLTVVARARSEPVHRGDPGN